MGVVLETNSISKKYKKHFAVDNLSIHVNKGDIYGIIGENGAGKTTLLKVISGLSKASSGTFSLFGLASDADNIKNIYYKTGTLIEYPALYLNLTAYDNLKVKALCCDCFDKDYINEILDTVGLKNIKKKKVKFFSLGMKQRLGIALALVGKPELLVLDEPVNGLDPQGIADVRKLLLKLVSNQEITVIISSHLLGELYKIANRFAIIHKGRLISELSKEEIDEKCGEYIEIVVEDPSNVAEILKNNGVSDFTIVDKAIHIGKENDVASINSILSENKVRVSSIGMKQKDLEQYYLDIIGGEKNA